MSEQIISMYQTKKTKSAKWITTESIAEAKEIQEAGGWVRQALYRRFNHGQFHKHGEWHYWMPANWTKEDGYNVQVIKAKMTDRNTSKSDKLPVEWQRPELEGAA